MLAYGARTGPAAGGASASGALSGTPGARRCSDPGAYAGAAGIWAGGGGGFFFVMCRPGPRAVGNDGVGGERRFGGLLGAGDGVLPGESPAAAGTGAGAGPGVASRGPSMGWDGARTGVSWRGAPVYGSPVGASSGAAL